MRRALFCAALVWLAGALVLAGELPDHPLSLREVLEVLRARSPMLAAARKPTDATAAKEITAGLRPNSVFTSANEDFNVFNFQRAGFPYDRVQLEGLLGLEDLPPSFDIEGELVAPELTLTTQELAQKALAGRPDYLRRTF